MSPDPSTARLYRVEGMTCEHCTAAVTEAVQRVDGVTRLEVERASGRLTVDGDHVSDAAIRAAVEEAGYTLADAA